MIAWSFNWCLACLGFRQGQIRSKGSKRHALSEISSDVSCGRRAKQARYGYAICDLTICNDQNCWYLHKSGGDKSTSCFLHFNWLCPHIVTGLEHRGRAGPNEEQQVLELDGAALVTRRPYPNSPWRLQRWRLKKNDDFAGGLLRQQSRSLSVFAITD
jgi:hypothetical protein